MSTVWFTADFHLGHGNIIKYCNRPFLSYQEKMAQQTYGSGRAAWRVSDETIQRHDAALLNAINSLVQKKDKLWILGGLFLGKHDVVQAYLSRIHYRHVALVWGQS